MSVIAESIGTVPSQPKADGASRVQPLAMTKVPLDQWDVRVADFDGLCQEQLMAFAGVRWAGATPEACLFEIQGEVVGGCLVVIQPLPLGLTSIAMAKWGPMLANVSRPDANVIYAGMVEAMIAEYSTRRRMLLSIVNLPSVSGDNTENQYLGQRGFSPGVLLNYPLRYIVNLQPTMDDVRKSLDQKWRRQLNKSEKGDLSFEHGTAEQLDEFTELYNRMLGRKRFADYSAYETVPHLLAIGHPQAQPELFFVRSEGELVAGAIVFKGGDRAVYLYGATTDKALPLRAGYFLHWNIMNWLKENTSARWYDLGGTDGFLGLHQFKKGMVGSDGVIAPVPRVANYADSRLAYVLGNGALWAREAFHEVLRRLNRLRKDRAQPTMPRYIDKSDDARL